MKKFVSPFVIGSTVACILVILAFAGGTVIGAITMENNYRTNNADLMRRMSAQWHELSQCQQRLAKEQEATARLQKELAVLSN